MTDQEKFNAEVRLKTSLQETRFSMTMQELREQREDIRRLNEKIDSLGRQINDTWRQTMVGVGGMIIALGALLITALK